MCRAADGEQVPPLQLEWHGLGFLPAPNMSGVAEALIRIERGEMHDADSARQRAASFVHESLSAEAVTSSLAEMLLAPKRPPPFFTRRYGEEVSHSQAEWEAAWTVVADLMQAPDADAIGRVISHLEAAGDGAPQVALLQTMGTDNVPTPQPGDLESGRLTARPVVAIRTPLLRR